MPQLNPAPWFFIFLTSWLVLFIIFKMKTLSTTQTTHPAPINMTKQQTKPWNWPWI